MAPCVDRCAEPTEVLASPELKFDATTVVRAMSGSVKTSRSSRLCVENSETIAPSGPAWNQCSVLGGTPCSLGTLIRTIKKAGVTAPTVVGGAEITDTQARTLGADHWAHDVDDAVRLLAAP